MAAGHVLLHDCSETKNIPRPGPLITDLPSIIYYSRLLLRRKPSVSASLKHSLWPGLSTEIFKTADIRVGGKRAFSRHLRWIDLVVLMEQKQLREKTCFKKRTPLFPSQFVSFNFIQFKGLVRYWDQHWVSGPTFFWRKTIRKLANEVNKTQT